MEILIDEAGSFAVKNAPENSWCVVAAYVCPETEKSNYKRVLGKLKSREAVTYSSEIKINKISEENYIQFLIELNAVNGALFATATDSGLNFENLVKEHQAAQAASMLKNIDEMKYESGKDAVRYLTSQLTNLPAQLYIQLCCQIQLIHAVVARGINYFVQRNPYSLKHFRWRIDQKEITKITNFEDAFEKFCPALLQTISLDNPMPALNWCNYKPMEKFLYKKGKIPEYLVEKFPHLKSEEGFNIQKIVRKDMKFLDSKKYLGVQVADLLASGLRRLMRLEFENNLLVAKHFGKLMVQENYNQSPIKLVTYGKEGELDNNLSEVIRLLIKYCKPMINEKLIG